MEAAAAGSAIYSLAVMLSWPVDLSVFTDLMYVVISSLE